MNPDLGWVHLEITVDSLVFCTSYAISSAQHRLHWLTGTSKHKASNSSTLFHNVAHIICIISVHLLDLDHFIHHFFCNPILYNNVIFRDTILHFNIISDVPCLLMKCFTPCTISFLFCRCPYGKVISGLLCVLNLARTAQASIGDIYAMHVINQINRWRLCIFSSRFPSAHTETV